MHMDTWNLAETLKHNAAPSAVPPPVPCRVRARLGSVTA